MLKKSKFILYFMKAFFGGQIIEKYRGDLAIVLERDEPKGEYAPFMYPVISDEFVQLTGIRAARKLPDRVYMGISHDAGERIINSVSDQKFSNVSLRNIDRMIVIPHFLNIGQEKPEFTRGGVEYLKKS